jgi:hypothetical protein
MLTRPAVAAKTSQALVTTKTCYAGYAGVKSAPILVLKYQLFAFVSDARGQPKRVG